LTPGLTTSVANDPNGNTIGLLDGNFFLNTDATKVTDGNGKQLDGDRNGTFGGNGVDEFWRMYGDANGDRWVDGLDNQMFNSTFGKSSGQSGFLWYFDSEGNGAVDTTDRTAFRNRRNGNNPFLAP
jgi:hypothetical protein